MVKDEGTNIDEEILKVLKEILKWTKFQAWRKVKELLLSELKDEKMKIIYHSSDGKSTREIEKITGVGHSTIHNYWKRWSKVPIVEPIIVKGKVRYKKMFELEDFGIEVTKLSERGY